MPEPLLAQPEAAFRQELPVDFYETGRDPELDLRLFLVVLAVVRLRPMAFTFSIRIRCFHQRECMFRIIPKLLPS